MAGLMAVSYTHLDVYKRQPFEALRQLLAMLASMALKLAFAAFLLALLDLGYTRFEFKRKMRMSKRDVKDEVKNREGDPRVRSRLRSLRVEMLQKSASVREVGQADVLIVNPTPVSYTHLDVYKRQASRWLSEAGFLPTMLSAATWYSA